MSRKVFSPQLESTREHLHGQKMVENPKKAIFFLRQTGERDENSASLDLSKIQIFWSRSDVPNELFSHTAPLGYLPVTNPDLDKAIKVKPNLPPEIKLHQAFNLELSITNGKAQNPRNLRTRVRGSLVRK